MKASQLDAAFQAFSKEFDREHGGFGRSTKFPKPLNLIYLLRYWHRTGNSEALAMVEKTLSAMRKGSIYDHLGYGFHRYATDPMWRLPHFEKMLYDQALLVLAYIETYQATAKEFYARTVREILTYILRDMTSEEGGFYSAEDADSEGVEGKFYLWTPREINNLLGKKEAAVFNRIFNVKEGGNFEEAGPGHNADQNILHLQKPLSDHAKDMGISEEQLRHRLEAGRQTLFEARAERIHPFKDDKILTDWNGLMIAALAKAGSVLDNQDYQVAASRAADFILQHLTTADGRLLKRYRQDKSGLAAHLNDYAFMVWGLIDLYQATYQVKYLSHAIALNDQMLAHFWDEQNGGLYITADDGEKLLVRSKEIYDGAIPSGNSVAVYNLLRLAHMTGKTDYTEKAEAIIKALSDPVKKYPAGHSQLMVALEFALNPSYEVVIVGDPQKQDTRLMLAALRRPFIPEKIVLFRPADKSSAEAITAIAPFTRSMAARNGQATAYVCQEFACKLPTTSIEQMLENLKPALSSSNSKIEN